MNHKWNSISVLPNWIFLVLIFPTCGLTSGCLTDIARSASQVRERFEPQRILLSHDGKIAIEATTTYYHNQSAYTLDRYGSHQRYVVLNPPLIRYKVRNTSQTAEGAYLVRNVSISNPRLRTNKSQYPFYDVTVIPDGFFDSLPDKYPPTSNFNHALTTTYKLTDPVPYNDGNNTVLLSFVGVEIKSERKMKEWWYYPTVLPAIVIDTGLSLPIAAVTLSGFVLIAPFYAIYSITN